MKTFVGILLALLGTLGAVVGMFITYTTFMPLLDSEDPLATGLMVMGSSSGLTLTLVGLIAMYISIAPKETGPRKKRIDTH